MKYTERELILAKDAITLYGKTKGIDSICEDDFNFIIENCESGSSFLKIIADNCGVSLGELRAAIRINEKIAISVLTDKLLLRIYISNSSIKKAINGFKFN